MHHRPGQRCHSGTGRSSCHPHPCSALQRKRSHPRHKEWTDPGHHRGSQRDTESTLWRLLVRMSRRRTARSWLMHPHRRRKCRGGTGCSPPVRRSCRHHIPRKGWPGCCPGQLCRVDMLCKMSIQIRRTRLRHTRCRECLGRDRDRSHHQGMQHKCSDQQGCTFRWCTHCR